MRTQTLHARPLVQFISDLHANVLSSFFFLLQQYKSRDTSPLSTYVMHPFWNNVVKVRFGLDDVWSD